MGMNRRGASPSFEALEGRCTPTTLPAGFTEAAVTTGLAAPTAMEFAPDGRLFVLEQSGNVELVRADGTTWTALHLNVDSAGERGLLGIAFDPGFATDHFAYLYYTNPGAGASPWATGEHNQLSRFTVDDTDPTMPVFGNEAPILDWDNLSTASNHNGGAIHFGTDGMLYADAGDNAQTFTQGGNTYRVSQTLNDLLGKQLRVDVGAFNRGVATRDDTAVGHLIPADNPFVGVAPGIDQLIYALGLRNPFTFAVQPGTGTIFINDVGEAEWEEIDRSVAGANFGWSGGATDGFGQTPPGPGVYHDPQLAYNHTGGPAGGGMAIVGGTFYDPAVQQFPASYAGKYFYADLGFGYIRLFDPAHPGTATDTDTSSPFASGITGNLIDLKVDRAGSLYYLTGSGTVEKISYPTPATGALTPDETFVRSLYRSFLGRDGTTAELDFHAAQVATLGRDGVSRSVAGSPEGLAFVVNGLYRTYLGRDADPGGLATYTAQLSGGATTQTVAAELLGSAEYAGKVPAAASADSAFVTSLYATVLGRSGSDAEVAYWVGLLPTLGRQGEAQAFLGSGEYRAVAVAADYVALLGRPASAAEVSFYATSPIPLDSIPTLFASSDEFYARA